MSIPIRPKKNDKVLNCLAFNENDKELKFKITNNSQSSSLLDFGTHKETYPNINFVTEKTLKSVRLDSMLNMNDSFELINIDVQGVEKEALEGLGNLITKAQYIYSEVNKANVYLNCTLIEELDLYLKHFAFKRIVTRMVPGAGWGDALYIRHPKLSIIVKGKILEAKYLLIDFSNRIISRIYNKIYFHFRK
jgi:FkbM family methyltransferase